MNIKNRNIALCIIFSFLSFGLYGLYWKAKMVDEINYVSLSNPKPSGVVVVILSIITFGIYRLIWDFNAGTLLLKAEELNDIYNPSNHGIIYLLLDLFSLGLVTDGLMQYELNKIADQRY